MIGVHKQTGQWHGLTSRGSIEGLNATPHSERCPNWRRFIFVLVACLALTGCYDTRQEITLNPDGSGKAVLESTLVQFDWTNVPETEEASAVFVRKLIQDAEGVDAWRDVACQELDDGRLSLRATAYFRDLSKFKTSVNGLENLRAVELFSGRLSAGATSREFGAELEFVGSLGLDREKILLRTELPAERLRWVKVYSEGGQSVELSMQGSMQVGSRRTYTLTAPGRIPRSGRLVAGILTGDRTVRIPFSLTNVSLLGQPLAAR